MKTFSKLKKKLWTISLSLLGACAVVPQFPDVNQCALRPNALYCVTTQTKVRTKIDINSPEAKDAQCLPVNDKQQSYQQAEQWVETVKQIAETRCR